MRCSCPDKGSAVAQRQNKKQMAQASVCLAVLPAQLAAVGLLHGLAGLKATLQAGSIRSRRSCKLGCVAARSQCTPSSPDGHDLAELDKGGAQALQIVHSITRQRCLRCIAVRTDRAATISTRLRPARARQRRSPAATITIPPRRASRSPVLTRGPTPVPRLPPAQPGRPGGLAESRWPAG